ncbi:hypothetical protein [Photobacterium sp. TY1-4]|uniref:hypothetical protein n=1 Tax=Photobacterium sp. TY1-4 TaxID=2899122 RepID=UPI0021C0DA74|nr:hypothetical protein [Photobacterium sp. TY1-4]UXI04002.1 hypothetical protein NH461_17975 [Photobacterium sp. TY1-4]
MLLTTALTGVAVVVVVKSAFFFEPALPIEWIRLIALLIGIFALVCAWGHTLLALKCAAVPPPEEFRRLVEQLDAADQADHHQHLAEAYRKATAHLLHIVEEKQRNLSLAYEEMTMSAWFFGIVALIAIGIEILN